ncbi:hypothetical protein CAOG_05196 [Capsaspora owczarzaki ATCC 30864]|uniref:Uncharacterized protein n=1 Tax=Capsaspora owczarzaki (strain ATCC 30864) TaxID=595528 RepID=A0A0D2VTI4_CAPO3|nr:hypothetical protein CAOG_05196 [Capsaspora owczarzaki ATCC 30864]KJE94567.1 hypothetical protein CAOG_005196 [Capsaspora owczarzaki ATCC 30864]|eukprot:XP_004346881.1 hypothetical protein CAOG_05196 [Capsaspora owczarzaki ATCC 30864]
MAEDFTTVFLRELQANPAAVLGAIVLPAAGGVYGSRITRANLKTWYAKLNKPWFNPPNYLFPPVWMILYTLSGFASYLIWKEDHIWPLVPYAISIITNNLWTPLFFGFHLLNLALLDLLVLWVSLASCIALFHPINELAAMLLLPYIAWVSFAGVLNFSILLKNPSTKPSSAAAAATTSDAGASQKKQQ